MQDVVEGVGHGDAGRFDPPVPIAGVDDAGPGEAPADAVLADTSVAEKGAVRADQAEVQEMLDDGRAEVAGGVVGGG